MTNQIIFTPISTETATAWRNGALDAYRQKPVRRSSDGGAPCRYCLQNVPAGEAVLLGAYKPFSGTGAFTETGPIFICEKPCTRFDGVPNQLPPVIAQRDQFIMRGYSADEQIDYNTGQLVHVDALIDKAQRIFEDPDVAFIHIRSAAYTCFTTRIDRAN